MSLRKLFLEQPNLLYQIKWLWIKKVESIKEKLLENNNSEMSSDNPILKNVSFLKTFNISIDDSFIILKEFKELQYLNNPCIIRFRWKYKVNLDICDNIAKALKIFNPNDEKRLEWFLKKKLKENAFCLKFIYE